MPLQIRMDFPVEIVQQSDQSPVLRVFAEVFGIGTHRIFD
jgi:hypothetical protein